MKCENENCENEAGNWEYDKKKFCSGDCMQEHLNEKNLMVKKLEPSSEILTATHIGGTHSSKALYLDRWECPHCRNNKASECRFNLNPQKRGMKWTCRFCKSKLILEYKK